MCIIPFSTSSDHAACAVSFLLGKLCTIAAFGLQTHKKLRCSHSVTNQKKLVISCIVVRTTFDNMTTAVDRLRRRQRVWAAAGVDEIVLPHYFRRVCVCSSAWNGFYARLMMYYADVHRVSFSDCTSLRTMLVYVVAHKVVGCIFGSNMHTVCEHAEKAPSP